MNSNFRHILSIYAGTFFLSLHTYLVLYINSSFIGKYASETVIGVLYALSAVITLAVYFNVAKILNKIGNFWFTIGLIVLSAISILGMITLTNSYIILALFVVYQTIISIIFFNLDLFLEHYTKSENNTGSVRAIFLTLSNTALVMSPAIVSFVLTNGDYWRIYFLSLLCFVPMLLIMGVSFFDFKDPHQKDLTLVSSIKEVWQRKDVYRISMARFVLEIFYAVMVVYTPIYLYTVVGFSWAEIGTMFTIMLLPFMLFELPIGRIADKWLGEKEILIFGFVITAIATLSLSLVTLKIFWLWALILFLTRTGASFVEITTESYFFKHVKSKDAQEIAVFRSTRALSYIVGPLLAVVTLYFVPFRIIFAILSIIVFVGVFFAAGIKDTR